MERVRKNRFLGLLFITLLIGSAKAGANAGYEGPGGGADQGVLAVYRTNAAGVVNPKARWNGRCLTCHGSLAGGGGNLTAFGNVFRGASLAERIRNASQGTNANLDSDNDGATNAAELQGCSDPFNPQQTPANLNPIPSHCLGTDTTAPVGPTLPPAQAPSVRDQNGLAAGGGGGATGGGTLTAGCGSKQNAGARASGELWFLMAFPALAWSFLKRRKS